MHADSICSTTEMRTGGRGGYSTDLLTSRLWVASKKLALTKERAGKGNLAGSVLE